MSNDHQDHDHNARGLPFNIGTTLQNVFRHINHALSNNHDNAQQRADDSLNSTDDMPPLEPLSAVGGEHDTRATEIANPFSSSISTAPNPNPSISVLSAPPSANVTMPPSSQLDPQRDDDEDSMPDFRSMSDSSDSSLVFNSVPPHSGIPHTTNDGHGSAPTDGPHNRPLYEPVTGSRRARVDDDEDDARDRRHPSERVGGSPPGDAAPQNTNPQQPRPPAGLFGALFGLVPPGGGHPAGDVPPEHMQAGDVPPAGANPAPGQPPRGGPILTAGFTLTIPFFGPPPGQAMGGQAQGGGLAGLDATMREELFASFATFFQEFQAMEEGREDPERAKKLIAGLEVIPLGLVKRLERVGGAPGGHVGDASTEGSSSGCAICWDTLLDAESDSFSGLQLPGGSEEPQPSSSTIEHRTTTHTERDEMDVDASSVPVSQSEPGTSASTPPPLEPVNIISLPCAHVFHASCLLPWFTRARQATCPTCRFNIDPENLTYTPLPRQAFHRPAPAQPQPPANNSDENANPNANPNLAPTGPQLMPHFHLFPPPEAPQAGATSPPGDHTGATDDPHPAPPLGQVPPGTDFNMPQFGGIAVPMMTIPLTMPTRPMGPQMPTETQAQTQTQAQMPGDGNQGIDVVTIGLDMFVGGPPLGEGDGEPRENAQGGAANEADNGGTAGPGTGPAPIAGAQLPGGLARDLQSLIEGLVRTTQNIIPQMVHQQGQAPAPGPGPTPDGAITEGTPPQTQAGAVSDAAGAPPLPPLHPFVAGGGPRMVPIFRPNPNMFRPTRPMAPLRERKTWALPPAPGPSLRQRVEQREREEGLRCSDTSCGVGPSDDDPYPEISSSLMKQVHIRPLQSTNGDDNSGGEISAMASVCAHAFHPACLVSAERVAGWGGEDKNETEPLVEVSCPICRAVGCVTKEEWMSGVSAL